MASLYDRIASTDDGSRRIASARLRREVLKLIHRAHRASGLSQVELARKLGVRKSAVNQVLRGDGNVRITTAAEYLHAMGYEMTVSLVPAGQPRAAVLERRARATAAPRGAYVSARFLAAVRANFDLALNAPAMAAALEGMAAMSHGLFLMEVPGRPPLVAPDQMQGFPLVGFGELTK
jgi:transcriptional regulator with XRE-family HTH domain